MGKAEDILRFWFGEAPGPARKAWFEKNPDFDAEIASRFMADCEAAEGGGFSEWTKAPRTALALIVLCDQFPRNMFRGSSRAFATDPVALAVARDVVDSGWDRAMLAVERMFAYLPFEHSESPADQVLSCELMKPLGEDPYRYAVRHKEIIDRFGRFPHRNAILGRESSAGEVAFLKEPGSRF